MSCAVNDELLETLYEESLEEIENFYRYKGQIVTIDQIDEEAIKLAMKRFESLAQWWITNFQTLLTSMKAIY